MTVKTIGTLVFTLICAFSTLTFAGGQSGGGGSVVFRDTPILLDFLNVDPNFKDSDNSEALGLKASRLKERATARFSFDRVDGEQLVRDRLAPFDMALNAIETWEKLPLEMTGVIMRSGFYEPLGWSFVDHALSAKNIYKPVSVLPNEKVEVAAYYTKNGNKYTVQIDTAIWNQMGLMSQAGLVMHEALRQVQIGQSREFDERTLQQAVSILILCKPERNLDYYLNWLTQNRADIAVKLYGNFDDMIKKHCERVN